MHDQTQHRTWPRLLALLLLYDLVAISGPGIVVWYYWFGGGVFASYLGITSLRTAASCWLLYVLFQPLRRWQSRTHEFSDDELLETDRKLQSAARRFAHGYVLILVVAIGLLTAWVQYSAGGIEAGSSELLMAGLVVLSAVIGVSSMLSSLTEPQLLGARSELGAELAARGLASRRVRTSLMFTNLRLNVSFSLAIFYFAITLVGAFASESWRATGLAEQRLRALAAQTTFEQTGELPPGFELVDDAQLPAQLREPDAAPTVPNIPVYARVDIRHAEAIAAVPLQDGRWLLGRHGFDTHVDLLVVLVLAGPFAFLLPLFAANLASARAHTRQLEELHQATQRILSGGQLHDIVRIHPPQHDELGQLTLDFNDMLDVFEQLAAAAKTVAAGDLTASLTGTGDLHDAFRGMLARLQSLVGQLQATTYELAASATQLQLNVDEHDRVIIEQSQMVDEISLTLEHLSQAAKNVNISATEVLDNADRTRSNADAMVGEIAKLTAHAADIGELLASVREIASRSDLLALNGSLEATRAGEAGRGFSLVATEMRRLAERIAETVIDMQGRVVAINDASTSTEAVTAQTRTLAEQTAETARRISRVIEAQSDDTRRAVGSMYELGERVDGSSSASSSVRDASKQLTAMAGGLSNLLDEFRVKPRT